MIPPDEHLIERFRDGDDLSFVMIYNRYKKQIHGFCIKMLRDGDAAADATQAVFLKVFERRQQVRHADRFISWLFAIARNECLTALRKADVVMPLDEAIESYEVTDDGRTLERDEERRLIVAAIMRLKPEYRELVVLREYQNLSYRDIADAVGVSEGMVKSRLFTARRILYDMLRTHFTERSYR